MRILEKEKEKEEKQLYDCGSWIIKRITFLLLYQKNSALI